jgi:Spy/CpxP family protein refolding chaperone
MSQLLGDNTSPQLTADQRRNYGELSAEKIRQVNAINKDYGELAARTRDEMKGILLPEDREKLNFLEKEKHRDLANVLTPQELEELDLRSSDTASGLKSRTAEFQPSEGEYRTLFKLQQAFDAQYGTRNLTPEETRLRDEAMPKLLAEIEASLGPERFADYEIKTNPAYADNQYFVAHSGLPAQMTDRLVSVQREMTQRATALKADQSSTPEQRYAQLTSLAEEASAKINATLGSEAFDRYKKSTGLWLIRLRPTVPKAASH